MTNVLSLSSAPSAGDNAAYKQDDVEGAKDNFMNTYRDISKYAGTAILS